MTHTIPQPRNESRRSTRVPIRVQIEVRATGLTCDGETILVNLHGALVKTLAPLELGARITIHVHLTTKSADARVVFSSREAPLEFGIALDRPREIQPTSGTLAQSRLLFRPHGAGQSSQSWHAYGSDRGLILIRVADLPTSARRLGSTCD